MTNLGARGKKLGSLVLPSAILVLDIEAAKKPNFDSPENTSLALTVRRLFMHAVAQRLGRVFMAPVAVVLSEYDVVQPDNFFIEEERARLIGAKTVEGAPDLVIEVVSPFTAMIDRGPKLILYGRADVAEYWLVDPAARAVEVHEFGTHRRTSVYRDGQSLKSTLLPGLTLQVSKVIG